jgi:hypothetical protein
VRVGTGRPGVHDVGHVTHGLARMHGTPRALASIITRARSSLQARVEHCFLLHKSIDTHTHFCKLVFEAIVPLWVKAQGCAAQTHRTSTDQPCPAHRAFSCRPIWSSTQAMAPKSMRTPSCSATKIPDQIVTRALKQSQHDAARPHVCFHRPQLDGVQRVCQGEREAPVLFLCAHPRLANRARVNCSTPDTCFAASDKALSGKGKELHVAACACAHSVRTKHQA